MTVTERHHPPCHYLFNTDVIDEDLSVFDIDYTSDASGNNNGRGTVYFKSLNTSKNRSRNTSTGNTNVVVKRYQRGGMVRHFNKGLYWHRHYNQSRVWQEFKLLVKMTSMGLPVPEPVAGRVKRKFPQWYESTIVTREIEYATTLADRLSQHSKISVDNKLWPRIGETIKRFHTANINHADLNASNILLTENPDLHNPEVYLIDFDKGCFMPDDNSGWKKNNLERLQRSLLKYQQRNDQFQYTAENWNTFLAAYEHR